MSQTDTKMIPTNTRLNESKTSAQDAEFELITARLVEEWEAGIYGEPTFMSLLNCLARYTNEYPAHAEALTDFALEYADARRANREYDAGASAPYTAGAERAADRVRERLGLPAYVTDADVAWDEADAPWNRQVPAPAAVETPPATFPELMKAQGKNLLALRNALGVRGALVQRFMDGKVSEWGGAAARRLADALGTTADAVDAALRATLARGGPALAGAHFSAQGKPDSAALGGDAAPLAETLDQLGFSAEEKQQWLGE